MATRLGLLPLLLAACVPSAPVELDVAPPAASGARSAALELGADGAPRLSWIEGPSDGPFELRVSTWGNGGWRAASVAASGSGWFVNWADVPRVSALSDGRLLATFLERSGSETYDYRVRWKLGDGAPATLHDDAGAGEHGFVSLVPFGSEHWFAAWLDGRASGGHHDGSGSMQLRARFLRSDGTLEPELLLDERVCDCCATASARVGEDDVLVVYRDRDAQEVRDLAAVRIVAGSPSAPVRVADDGWKIAGCPVNGPAIAARAGEVAIAWFTLGAESRARVQLAFSSDGGRSFSTPLQVSRRETDGFVDCAWDSDGTLWLSWLERPTRDTGEWMLAPVRGGVLAEPRAVASTLPGRAAGVAQLACVPDGVLFVWLETTAPGQPARLRSVLAPR